MVGGIPQGVTAARSLDGADLVSFIIALLVAVEIPRIADDEEEYRYHQREQQPEYTCHPAKILCL
jgi:hypothetical protein